MHDNRITTVTPVSNGELKAIRMRMKSEDKKAVRARRKRQRAARNLQHKK